MKQEISISNKTPGYLTLLHVIGVPGKIEGSRDIDYNDRLLPGDLFKLAELNKIGLLYLSAVDKTNKKNEQLSENYKNLTERNQLLLDVIKEVGSTFNEKTIAYSIFKTIKPFPTTPSDVDVLVNKQHFAQARSLLSSTGFTISAQDAFSCTMQRGTIIVDLQLQPSVANLPYLPYQLIMGNTRMKNIQGVDVCTPSDEAELLIIACHSIFKEQLFTLNDYYSTVLLAERVDIDNLLALARDTKTLKALEIVIRLSAKITESAFGSEFRIVEIKKALQSSFLPPEIGKLPLRLSFFLVIRLLFARALGDPDMRKMLIPSMIRMVSPKQISKLVSHFRRSTY